MSALIEPDVIRLLLVEDDDGDALFVSELLDLARIKVELTRALTLAEAEDRLAVRYDCILLDLQLPDARGETVVRRAADWATTTAVIVLTGNVDENVGYEAVERGAQDYLIKSRIDASSLARSIRYAISRRRFEEQSRTLLEERLARVASDRIGRGLLPAPLVSSADVELVARYRPGGVSVIGGDFIDAVEMPDGTIRAVVGDVAGHGPDEAALGVSLRIAWRSLVLAGQPPERVLRLVDQLLAAERHNDGVFVTALDLTIPPSRRGVEVRQAGHPCPFLLTPRLEVLPCDRPGPALGIFDEPQWPAQRVALPPGWTIFGFTDGLVEGYSGVGDERLGVDGVLDLARAIGPDRPDRGRVCDELLAEVESRNGGPLVDDVAILVISDRRPR